MSSKSTSSALTDRLFPMASPSAFGRRLTRVGSGRIPIVVVTGFLGAGKTSLVRRLLATPEGRGSAVIVNEFGEIGIDDAMLRASGETTVLLGNGCVCCAMRSDLEETLAHLLAEAATGAIPSFSRVIVETTGLADPGPILQTFAADRGIGREFHLETVITVADAPTIEDKLATVVEAERQVLLADRIVVTKVDLVPTAQGERIARLLSARNPVADVMVLDSDPVDAVRLLEPPALPRRLLKAATGRHTQGISTFTLLRDEPTTWSAFANVMDTLIDLRGPDLLRMKGFLAVRGMAGPLVVHAVQHILHPPAELLCWPDGDRRTRLVFVVRDIERSSVAALMDAIVVLADEQCSLRRLPERDTG